MRMNTSVPSAAIGGVVATVVYAVIALVTGESAGRAIGIGILIGGSTFVVSFLITRVIVARKGGRA